MDCPKCSSHMKPVTVHEFTVDRCESCEGIWFDLREHDHLREIADSEKKIDTGAADKGAKMDAVRDVECPRCHVPMMTLAFPDQPHIHYEQCSTCGGAFLDAGEFTDWKELTLSERLGQFLRPFRKVKT